MTEHHDRSDADSQSADKRPPRFPRWVLVTLIVVGALVTLLVVLELTGAAGDHGPGQHGPDDHEPPVEHGS